MVIDANIVLRFLLKDNTEQFKKTQKLFTSGDSFTLTDVTIMEISYVLMGQYHKTRVQVASALNIFISQEFITYYSGLASQYLTIYSEESLDLADCYLICVALLEDSGIVTFDQKMLKVYNRLLSVRQA